MVEVVVECTACGATGLYKGCAESPGVGVVCWGCDGTGRKTLIYKPFAGRIQRSDIQTVHLRVESGGSPVSYAAFLAGIMPTTTKGGAS